MITFKHGMLDDKDVNAAVTFAQDKTPSRARSERDPEGNIKVTYDRESDPEDNDDVFLVLISENSGEYRGKVVEHDGVFVFTK